MKKLNEVVCGLLCGAALFSIMTLTFFDVLGRKLLSHSIPGSLEMTELLMVAVIFAGLPLVSRAGEHIVFDSLDAWLPKIVRRVQQALVDLLCAAALLGIAWVMAVKAGQMAEYGDTTVHLQLSIAPVAWMMAAMLASTNWKRGVLVMPGMLSSATFCAPLSSACVLMMV